jgi:hypothetical protein
MGCCRARVRSVRSSKKMSLGGFRSAGDVGCLQRSNAGSANPPPAACRAEAIIALFVGSQGRPSVRPLEKGAPIWDFEGNSRDEGTTRPGSAGLLAGKLRYACKRTEQRVGVEDQRNIGLAVSVALFSISIVAARPSISTRLPWCRWRGRWIGEQEFQRRLGEVEVLGSKLLVARLQ